ncbi:MAG: hypothetical protein Q9227_000860 [Pyrenula ochraceoflavens]
MPTASEEAAPFSESSSAPPFQIPPHFTHEPPLRDALETESSKLQNKVVDSCLPLLTAALDPRENPFDFNEHGLPQLHREEHIDFLKESLGEFPAKFIGIDASRPWMLYWALNGLVLLGENVGDYEDALIKTLTPLQSSTGGFGGGHGHTPHLASTFPAILAISTVASRSPNPTRLYSLIDRPSLHAWLSRLKQPSGAFRVTENGEQDVRGAYIALVLISLLDLPLTLHPDCPAAQEPHNLRTLHDNLSSYLSQCQSTLDGGVGENPGRESHGAYAFCAIAALCLLGEPREMVSKHLDVPALIRWLAARQNAPEGGFSGRTNKLVDVCYSYWVGACFPLIEGALNGPVADDPASSSSPNPSNKNTDIRSSSSAPTTLLPIGPLSSPSGLARYILSCAQQPGGGLRDKPGKPADSYHTNYALCGLSAAGGMYQHFYVQPRNLAEKFAPGLGWRVGPNVDVEGDEGEERVWEGEEDEGRGVVGAVHPIYGVEHGAVERIRRWAERRGEWGGGGAGRGGRLRREGSPGTGTGTGTGFEKGKWGSDWE